MEPRWCRDVRECQALDRLQDRQEVVLPSFPTDDEVDVFVNVRPSFGSLVHVGLVLLGVDIDEESSLAYTRSKAIVTG